MSEQFLQDCSWALWGLVRALVLASTPKHRLQVVVQASAIWVLRVYPSGRFVIDRDAFFVRVQTLRTIFADVILAALRARLSFSNAR